MPNWIPIDDASNQIGYSGSWSVVKGSTRQWEAGVHSTTQNGASCVLRFKGVGIAFRATVPSGSGNQVFDYKIDSRASVRISTAQKSSDEYGVELIRIENLPEAVHSITLTNAGGAPLQVDMFEYWPGTGDPNPAALFPLPAAPEPTTRPTPTPTPTPRPPQQNTSSPPQQSTRPPNTPQPEPDPDPPTSAERTRTVASSETQMITSPTTGTSDDSEPSNGSSRSSPSSSPSQSVPTGGRTIETTDENGLVITKIIPTATERMITSTDANGVVSAVTIVGAANTGNSVPLGAIIGIAIGSVIAILAVLIFILFCRRRRKRLRNARYTAQPQETQQTRGLGITHDGSAAAHSSTQLISPYAAHPSENATVPSGPVWRKEAVTDEGYPIEHERQPSSAVSGAGFSTHAGSGLSYTGENADASNDPPPAYRAPAQTLTEDSYSTASGMYGSERQ